MFFFSTLLVMFDIRNNSAPSNPPGAYSYQGKQYIECILYFTGSTAPTSTGMLSVSIASLAPLVSAGMRTQSGSGIRTNSLPLLQVFLIRKQFFSELHHQKQLINIHFQFYQKYIMHIILLRCFQHLKIRLRCYPEANVVQVLMI